MKEEIKLLEKTNEIKGPFFVNGSMRLGFSFAARFKDFEVIVMTPSEKQLERFFQHIFPKETIDLSKTVKSGLVQHDRCICLYGLEDGKTKEKSIQNVNGELDAPFDQSL